MSTIFYLLHKKQPQRKLRLLTLELKDLAGPEQITARVHLPQISVAATDVGMGERPVGAAGGVDLATVDGSDAKRLASS